MSNAINAKKNKKENDNRYKTKIIKEEEMMYPQLHHFLFVL